MYAMCLKLLLDVFSMEGPADSTTVGRIDNIKFAFKAFEYCDGRLATGEYFIRGGHLKREMG